MSVSPAPNLSYFGRSIVIVRTHKPLLLRGTRTHSLLPLLASTNHLPRLRNNDRSLQKTTSIKTAVAAVESSDPVNTQESKTKRYHFAVANAKFMLDEEEHFKELLSERLRLYGERAKEQDFWLVVEPKFLDKFPDITKRLQGPAVALVSTNGPSKR